MLTSTTTAPILRRLGVLGSRGLPPLQSALSATKATPITSRLARRQITAAIKANPRHICTKSRVVNASATATAAARPSLIQCQFISRRYASSSASSAAAATAAAPSESAAARPLDWNTFFTLRKTRRRYQMVCSVVTMSIGGSMAGVVLMSMSIDWLGKIPLDPFLTLGLMTMGCAALGWLAGPSLGSIIFYATKRGVKAPMAVKETEFFARIKKNRVDPSFLIIMARRFQVLQATGNG